jgi:hypothetical protein
MGVVQGTHRKVVCAVALLGGLQPSTSGENETLLSQSNGVGGLFRGAECYTLKRHKLKTNSETQAQLSDLPPELNHATAAKLGDRDLGSYAATNHAIRQVSKEEIARRQSMLFTDLFATAFWGRSDIVDADWAKEELKRRALNKNNENVKELAALLFFKIDNDFFLDEIESYHAFRSLFEALWRQSILASTVRAEGALLQFLSSRAPSAENEYLKDDSDDGVVRGFVDRRLAMIKMAWEELPPNTEVVGKDNEKHKLNFKPVDELEKNISHWINIGSSAIRKKAVEQEKLERRRRVLKRDGELDVDADVLSLILNMFKVIITSPSTDISLMDPKTVGAMRWSDSITLWWSDRKYWRDKVITSYNVLNGWTKVKVEK